MQTLDVRPMPARARHETIFERLDALIAGRIPRLVDGHDPALRYQLDATRPDQFRWSYVERGPEDWAIDITIIARTEAVELRAVLDLLAGVAGVDPDAVAGLTLAELDVADDLALLDLWAAVVEEYGERSLGQLYLLEPPPVTLGQLAEAFHAELSR